MLNQLSFEPDGVVRDKIEIAIKRLKTFEPPEGYYVAFSGGKDSQCVYHLCKMAGVKFDAHYAVTSVDPPELVRFIKQNYPDVALDVPHDEQGRRISMWSLIPLKRIPPTRIARYCCEKLKESSGKGRITITGVRWAESVNRRANQGLVVFTQKKTKRKIEELGVNSTKTVRGGVVLNYDDDNARRSVEHCYRTDKTLINPIIDWEEEDVWEFLNGNGIPHCSLYDEGFTRLGCIGCPMGGGKKQRKEFDRWPKYEELYRKAFEKMLTARKEAGLPCEQWENADDVMKWWLKNNMPGTATIQ